MGAEGGQAVFSESDEGVVLLVDVQVLDEAFFDEVVEGSDAEEELFEVDRGDAGLTAFDDYEGSD